MIISKTKLSRDNIFMSQPWITVVYFLHFSQISWGVINFCCKMNEISTISLLSPFIFYDFSTFDFGGFSVSHLLDIFVSWSLWAPLLEFRGFLLVPLPPIYSVLESALAPLASFWLPFDSLWLPLAPFGFLWAPFGSLWLPFGSLSLPFCSLLAPF